MTASLPLGVAAARGGGFLIEERDLGHFADVAMETYAMESARRLLAALQRGEALRASLLALGGMLRRETADTVALRRRAAALAVERGGYPLA